MLGKLGDTDTASLPGEFRHSPELLLRYVDELAPVVDDTAQYTVSLHLLHSLDRAGGLQVKLLRQVLEYDYLVGLDVIDELLQKILLLLLVLLLVTLFLDAKGLLQLQVLLVLATFLFLLRGLLSLFASLFLLAFANALLVALLLLLLLALLALLAISFL